MNRDLIGAGIVLLIVGAVLTFLDLLVKLAYYTAVLGVIAIAVGILWAVITRLWR